MSDSFEAKLPDRDQLGTDRTARTGEGAGTGSQCTLERRDHAAFVNPVDFAVQIGGLLAQSGYFAGFEQCGHAGYRRDVPRTLE